MVVVDLQGVGIGGLWVGVEKRNLWMGAEGRVGAFYALENKDLTYDDGQPRLKR